MKLSVSVYADGSSVIVDFGNLAINIPSGYKTAITEVSLGNGGTVSFKVNGEEDFLSIESTVLGEEPNSIIKDENGVGRSGLSKLVRSLMVTDWKIS